MECRIGCAACCIVVSIASPIPGMPEGKPAGIRCVQLAPDNRCKLFGKPERPLVCSSLQPSEEMCGDTDEHAHAYLAVLEDATKPDEKQKKLPSDKDYYTFHVNEKGIQK
jgi:uncharacterized protein